MTERKEEVELQEMIGEPRGWILRWGMSALLALLVLFLLLGFLISYPDRLLGTIQIYAGETPVEVHAVRTSRVTELLVDDGQNVEEKTWLAITENTAQTEDVLQLRKLLSELEGRENEIESINFPYLKLGPVQEFYSQLQFQIEYIREWKAADQTSAKLQLSDDRIEQLAVVANTLKRQEQLLIEESQMADQSLTRQRELYDRGAISLVELEAMERQVFQYRRELEELQIRQANNQQLVQVLQQDKLEMQEDQGKWIADRSATIQENLQQLRSALQEWEQQYVISAPSSGQVYFGVLQNSNQEVVQGDLVFTILPSADGSTWRGRMSVPDQGAGKIGLKDLVEVQLNDFPYEQFGVVEGVVAGISVTADAGLYQVDVALPSPLVTRYDKEIPLRPMLQGRASIVTEKRSLLSRIFDDLRARWSGN